MKIENLHDYSRYYFVGIGGISMSALAKWLIRMKKTVDGCDREVGGRACVELLHLGARIEGERSIDETALAEYEVFVHTDAVGTDHPALRRAEQNGRIVVSRAQLLFALSKSFHTVIGIAGCHGKTTTTAMLSHVFACAGKSFTCHIGGYDKRFSNFTMIGKDYLITEACEYRRNMLSLYPEIAVVLDDTPDHLECYGTEKCLKDCYRTFLNMARVSIAKHGRLNAQTTFGYRHGTFTATRLKQKRGCYSFVVCRNGEKKATICLSVVGKHHILNALATVAVAVECGIDYPDIVKGLQAFEGVARRFERIGTVRGAPCYADYAHHPDEIREAVRTAKLITKGRVFVVFQPHTYSRTKWLFDSFVKVLSTVPCLAVWQTFAAREAYDGDGSAERLAEAIKNARYLSDERALSDFLESVKREDIILFLGAGDIYEIAKAYINTRSAVPPSVPPTQDR